MVVWTNSQRRAARTNRTPEGCSSPARLGAVFVFADGSARHLSDKTDPAVLKALSNPAEGEPVSETDGQAYTEEVGP
jgi:hypothetical protein